MYEQHAQCRPPWAPAEPTEDRAPATLLCSCSTPTRHWYLPHSKPGRQLELYVILLQFIWKYIQSFFLRFYLILERGEGKEKERERNVNVWLPLACPLLGTWPAIQACALTGNGTSDPLFHRLALNPLSHTSQGQYHYLYYITHLLFRSLTIIALCKFLMEDQNL